jgi:hypothetical protein
MVKMCLYFLDKRQALEATKNAPMKPLPEIRKKPDFLKHLVSFDCPDLPDLQFHYISAIYNHNRRRHTPLHHPVHTSCYSLHTS